MRVIDVIAPAGQVEILLSLASGAAAGLSITTGLSSVLVGVMVAVALLAVIYLK